RKRRAMNLSLQDPFRSGDVPESVEYYLRDPAGDKANCLQYNRRGLLLCVGNQSGSVTIWDFETMSIARQLIEHKQCVNSVGWTRDGKKIISCSNDGSLILWNVVTATMEVKMEFESASPLLHCQLHPRNNDLCIVCPSGSPPLLVDLSTKKTTPLIAVYSRNGKRIVIGDWKGQITFLDPKTLAVDRTIKIPSGAGIKEFEFSRNGRYMLVNATDKIIRLYSLEMDAFVRDFQDIINRVQWRSCTFSNNCEYILAGMQHKSKQSMLVWSINGGLVKDLEGPKEGLHHAYWHPLRPLILTIGVSGVIFVWSLVYTERWSDFAPEFKELEENEEYVEREDEFDAPPDTGADQDKQGATANDDKMKIDDKTENEDVDITTIDRISEFSSDEEEEVFIFRTVPESNV
ncbi:hypothetical protein SAMD00019534_052470, partial [Acytostelium subglobosum LB1]|uniref:hypothetical protein n=1 Tax=Acytostelium subglobosum LB1 TaxID=1410327 RepID=UPI00064516F3